MGQLDASIVSLAYPTLEHNFGSTLWAVQWVGLSYLLVLISLVIAVGRLADRFGRKLLYTYGFIVFSAGSALCGLAPNLVTLDGFRALQALGAAMMQANSLAIIALATPRERLGRAIGVQGAAQALGLALGPAVGGGLIALGGWRLIFLVNVPVGLIGTIAAVFLIPRSRELHESRFDWPGLALLAFGLVALLVAVSFGNQLGWHSPALIALFLTAAVLTVGFLRWERRTSSPLVDLRLFRQPAFAAGIASGLLAYLVLFGCLFVIPFFLEIAHGMPPEQVGLLLIALPVALAVTAPFAGRAADSYGSTPPTVTGMLIASIALLLLAVVHDGLFFLGSELTLLGIGLGLFTPANNAAIMAAAPRSQSGMTSGILNMTRGLGTSLGLSLTGLVFGTIAGAHAQSAHVVDAFVASVLFLAAVALLAAALSGLRGGRALGA